MATPDPTNVLFKIAHPDLYARNPFNLLNLPIDATAKDIRRRQEDIDAAFEAGTEEEEFKYVLPLDENRKPPTLDAVHEAFDALNDPERRMAYALFWFWPDGDDAIIDKYSNKTLTRWFSPYNCKALGLVAAGINPSLTDRHNLAIMHHLSALFLEQVQTVSSTSTTKKQKNMLSFTDVHENWLYSIKWWNNVTVDPDFWHSVSEMVSSLNDPRLDHRFARSLRDQFAFSFDQINVELAIDFAKAGREADAKRQVEYMKLSQPDADDVEGTLNDAFAGLLRQTEAICKTARSETEKKPTDGLHQVNLILERSDEPLRISRIVLGKGTPVRNAIVSTIFSAVRNSLVNYGTKTDDWAGCLHLTSKMEALAETDEHKTLIAATYDYLLNNKKGVGNETPCWICKQKNLSEKPCGTSICVPLHGCLNASPDRKTVNYRMLSINVYTCRECLEKRKHSNILEDFPECIAAPKVLSAIMEGWRIGKDLSKDTIKECLEGMKLIPPKGKEVLFRDIELFHVWCKGLEQAFPYVKTLSEKLKLEIAQGLFSRLGRNAHNEGDVYSFLQVLKAEDKQSVHGSGHIDLVCRGGSFKGYHIEAALHREAYLAGYNFLSLIHFQQHPYHNVSEANRLLLQALENEAIGFCSVSSDGRSEGYQPSGDTTVLCMHVRRQLFWGLWKTYSELSVVVNMKALIPKNKTNLISIIVDQPNDQWKVCKTTNSVAKQITEQFHQRGFDPSLIRGKNADEVILCLSNVVKQLLSDLTICMKRRKCDIAGDRWPDAPSIWTLSESISIL